MCARLAIRNVWINESIAISTIETTLDNRSCRELPDKYRLYRQLAGKHRCIRHIPAYDMAFEC